MDWSLQKNSTAFSLLLVILMTVIPNFLYSQTTINGTVFYQKEDAPAPFVNIGLSNKSASTMADWGGNFKFQIANPKSTDTIVISSVGYESLRLPVSKAAAQSKFILKEVVKNLATVTVFNTHQTLGSMSESVGYFRSWSFEKTGGEIGRIFMLPYKKYKIDKVRFKVANLCDTCVLRVRIREVVDGKPGDEVLKDSVTLTINKLTLDDKAAEFDLTPYDITFKQNELFVSLEVLGCSSRKKEFCSFNFAGTDKGEYLYKSRTNTDWKKTEADGYTIYLKLFLRY
ncbi:MAG: carboxypeptidase-like regulatory domain-containing protein [Ferruginibacter sp.]